MLRKLRPRLPSHTTVVAYLGFFVALGTGGAYAANTIRSGDIVDGEVKTADLDSSAVTTAKVAFRGVTASKLADDSVGGRAVLNESLTDADIGFQSVGGSELKPQAVDPTKLNAANCTSAADTVSTASDVPVNLAGGPGAGGGHSDMVAIYVEAELQAATGHAARIFVSPGVGGDFQALSATSTTFQKRTSVPGSGNGSTTVGGWFVLRLQPGVGTTFLLKYASTGPDAETVSFRKRTICTFSAG